MVGFGSIFSLLMRIFIYELRIEETPHPKKRTQEDLNESETEDEDHKRFKSKENGNVDGVEGKNEADSKIAENENGVIAETFKNENEFNVNELKNELGEIKKRSQLVVKNALNELNESQSQAINAEIKNMAEIKKNL